MSDRSQLYMQAALAYEKDKRFKGLTQEMREIKNFFTGNEYVSGREMLSACGKKILVGPDSYDQDCGAYYLTGEGFIHLLGGNITFCNALSDENFLVIAEAFRRANSKHSYALFMDFISERLEKIAKDAPVV